MSLFSRNPKVCSCCGWRLFEHSTYQVREYHSEWHGSHQPFLKTVISRRVCPQWHSLYFPVWALILTSKSIYLLFSRGKLFFFLSLKMGISCCSGCFKLLGSSDILPDSCAYCTQRALLFSVFAFLARRWRTKTRRFLKEQELHMQVGCSHRGCCKEQ